MNNLVLLNISFLMFLSNFILFNFNSFVNRLIEISGNSIYLLTIRELSLHRYSKTRIYTKTKYFTILWSLITFIQICVSKNWQKNWMFFWGELRHGCRISPTIRWFDHKCFKRNPWVKYFVFVCYAVGPSFTPRTLSK